MRVELKKVQERLKTTIIYVTHDQVEAMTLADRIVVLNQGIIQQVGTPAELFDTPQNIFVAGFIGSPSMNLLELAAKRDGSDLALSGENMKIKVPAEEGFNPEKIIVGARPQDFIFDAKEPEITGTVEIVEALGRMSLIHVAVSENVKITAETESETARRYDIGSKIALSLKHEKLHFFDSAAQTRISDKINML